MITNNVNMPSALTDAQSISKSSPVAGPSQELQNQLHVVSETFKGADLFVLTDHQTDELAKVSTALARGNFSTVIENLKQLNAPSKSTGETSTAIEQTGGSHSSVTMAELLALMTEIIESSHELRSQVMQNRISEASATYDLAVALAADKCHDAQTKFGITLAASLITMGVSTFATMRMAQPKTLQDKHIRSMSGDETVTVKSLDAKTRNDYAARLQDARTGKYRGVSQGTELAQGVVGNVNEMQNAAQIRNQEETQATKEMKAKFDDQLTEYIQNLTQETAKLNEILDSIAKASLATNR
ncbi:type III secretion system protein [Vibrio sp. CUB2]|uniref:type III secretion system protein n=1 Tax=Vibrio sp. CUB2 TaxID=2315233 RepID=UPI000B0B5D7D|nr:type III secretion system protein [Vibrio sp. CUB2]